MVSGNGGVILERKRAIVSALCNPDLWTLLLSVRTQFLVDGGNDIKSLSVNIMKTAYENNEENIYAEDLSQLNEYLTDYSVLVGGGYRPSDADIIVFSTVHPYVISLPNTDRNKLPHLGRWMDYIQSTHDFGELFERILLEKAPFDPPISLPNTDRNKLPHLGRWMDYIQSTHDFGELFERILLEKAPFDPP
ncbi:hypothetical protein L1987_35772 [Smallanthus sonchifolius]|uniref:Uncharacterized protein n=1 Tax=Smallanthus sonchifolius TaxID=185202 RepID=A0ACB9HC73_9ASTR|nr:hypothetical protein L1987_35772 [Smallanthus sonchifolius]